MVLVERLLNIWIFEKGHNKDEMHREKKFYMYNKKKKQQNMIEQNKLVNIIMKEKY